MHRECSDEFLAVCDGSYTRVCRSFLVSEVLVKALGGGVLLEGWLGFNVFIHTTISFLSTTSFLHGENLCKEKDTEKMCWILREI